MPAGLPWKDHDGPELYMSHPGPEIVLDRAKMAPAAARGLMPPSTTRDGSGRIADALKARSCSRLSGSMNSGSRFLAKPSPSCRLPSVIPCTGI